MTTPDPSISFWYRRAMCAFLLLSVVFLLLSFSSLIFSDFEPLQTIMIPPPSIILAALALVTCVVGLLQKNDKAIQLISFLAYLILFASASYAVFTSGEFGSQLALLWILVAVFGSLWASPGVLITLSTSVVFGVYAYINDQLSSQSLILFIIAFVLPPIVSYVALHQQKVQDDEPDAYHALAKELSKVANKSEIIINAIGDGVIATDNKGVIQLINPAAQTIMGWGKQDAIDLDYRSVFKLFNNKDEAIPAELDPVQKVLHGNESIKNNDFILNTSSGKKMNISLLVSPLGKFGNGAIIVFSDITNEVSENSQRTEFISTASHEMRTPVAAIEGYLGLALNPATAQIDEKARLYLTKAHEAAQHLGELFQDLLDISKADDGRLNSKPEIVDLVAFTRESTAIHTLQADEKGLSLAFQPDVSEDSANTLVPIYYAEVDPNHLREVLSNLIDNAIKYTKDGAVKVDVSGDNEHVRVMVTDSGIGIAREDIPHLFQKFYRIDNSDTREIGGTGLGLYLCRRLVESMNGRLWIESEQGQGSTFFVELNRISNDEVKKRSDNSIVQTVQT